jgi:hypothetical protein
MCGGPVLDKLLTASADVIIFVCSIPALSHVRTGVDMISTGEVACFGKTREEAYIKVHPVALL